MLDTPLSVSPSFTFFFLIKNSSLLNAISMEEQVISRAHRMGATRPINVETLAMRGTIEEQMLEFLQVDDVEAPLFFI
jgi:hypothetical protein